MWPKQSYGPCYLPYQLATGNWEWKSQDTEVHQAADSGNFIKFCTLCDSRQNLTLGRKKTAEYERYEKILGLGLGLGLAEMEKLGSKLKAPAESFMQFEECF